MVVLSTVALNCHSSLVSFPPRRLTVASIVYASNRGVRNIVAERPAIVPSPACTNQSVPFTPTYKLLLADMLLAMKFGTASCVVDKPVDLTLYSPPDGVADADNPYEPPGVPPAQSSVATNAEDEIYAPEISEAFIRAADN